MCTIFGTFVYSLMYRNLRTLSSKIDMMNVFADNGSQCVHFDTQLPIGTRTFSTINCIFSLADKTVLWNFSSFFCESRMTEKQFWAQNQGRRVLGTHGHRDLGTWIGVHCTCM